MGEAAPAIKGSVSTQPAEPGSQAAVPEVGLEAARPNAMSPGEPITLADSLILECGWSEANFSDDGPNPPYVRIDRKLWITLTEFEPCFASARRDRGFFRSKVSMIDHLRKYDQIMVDPIAFEECYGPDEGRDTIFPFGAWLAIRDVGFSGIALWGRRQGEVSLPLEPLAVASAVWLRVNPYQAPSRLG